MPLEGFELLDYLRKTIIFNYVITQTCKANRVGIVIVGKDQKGWQATDQHRIINTVNSEKPDSVV